MGDFLEIAVISIIAIAVLVYELPPLIKNQWWRETAAFLILLSLGVFLAIAQALDLDIPTPVSLVEFVFSPVSAWVDNILS